jgi:FkbM family methyltransferase
MYGGALPGRPLWKIDMIQADAEEELDQLLSESPEAATRRMTQQGLSDETGNELYALYGAGELGREMLRRLRSAGVEPVVFADDTAQKQGTVIDGLTVMSPESARQKFGDHLVFVVTILNPLLNFLTARRRLKDLTGLRVISFLHLAWRYPQECLPYRQFESPSNILNKSAEIRRAWPLLADAESRRQFVAHLRFRLRLDYAVLPPSVPDNYFPTALLPAFPSDTVFVDCGAYDGDTIRAFLAHQGGRFKAIFAFEPDPQSYEQLRNYVSSLRPETAERIQLFQAALGEQRTRLRFDAAGNMSSSFSATGAIEVEVLPIDEVVKDDGGSVYLKFDVEGAEWEALRGSERLIARARPLLAISVYHHPDDLWQLPLWVAARAPGYRFYLRTQGEDGTEIICYCLPG